LKVKLDFRLRDNDVLNGSSFPTPRQREAIGNPFSADDFVEQVTPFRIDLFDKP
jgi:hypothetical protein